MFICPVSIKAELILSLAWADSGPRGYVQGTRSKCSLCKYILAVGILSMNEPVLAQVLVLHVCDGEASFRK
jgi:hypothetical protein